MNILLITPPLTQLNTPYPATAYLQSFLKSRNYCVHQADLGIELVNKIFNPSSLEVIFQQSEHIYEKKTSKNIRSIFAMQQQYISTIEPVMKFLRGDDLTMATRICSRHFLPEASRFKMMPDLDWAFGNLGLTDKARYIATMYIEDLTDFIREATGSYFELGRYAEHLSLFASDFLSLEEALNGNTNVIDTFMLNLLEEKITQWKPDLIGFSIPFPGNLYGALKCGQYIKVNYSHIYIAWGGGYVSTELRELSEPSVFKYVDYVLLDQGESGMLRLLEHIQNHKNQMVKTFIRDASGKVVLKGEDDPFVIPFSECGYPDYADLPLKQYISLIETANPMHKLWSDGQWNKLTLAQGCYWAKCAFCDTSLPYISDFKTVSSHILADRIENIITQTGNHGFHFVDEAAPPKI
jgi:hypothetical protein